MRRLTRFPRISKKTFIKIIFLFVVFFGLGFVLVFLPAKRLMASIKETIDEARALVYVAKQQDLPHTQEKIKTTQEKLEKTKKDFSYFSFLKFIPLLRNYYLDSEHLITAGTYGLQTAQIAVEALSPYADLLGFAGEKGSFVNLSGEERLETVILTLDKLTPTLGEVGANLKLVKNEVDQVNPSRYPQTFQGTEVRSELLRFKELVDQITTLVVDAQPLIEVLPELLGQEKPQRYLVLFQNDKELRPTGGFITAYAIFRLEKGKIIAEKSEDIYLLDETVRKTFPAPEPILRYLPKVYSWHLRDANLSPDFYLSMKQFEEMYEYAGGREEIDGIVAIDTFVLQRLIDVLGPIPAYGIQFTNEVVEECHCPQVIYELEKYADQPVGYMRTQRKGIIGVLMNAIMQRALGTSPGKFWPKLIETGLNSLSEKHIIFYLHDESAQRAMEKLGFAGRIRDVKGDYLHINDTNFAGAKANMYVQHQVEQEIEIKENGEVVKTLRLKYQNPEPPDDCSLERKTGLCLSATLRNWLRIYVPKGSTLLEAEGSQIKVEAREDLDKTYFEGFFEVRPLGSAQFVIKYQLPFKVKKGDEYQLLLQKQPGTEGHEYKILREGELIEEFKLTTDREVKFKV